MRSIRVFYHSAVTELSSNGVARGSVSNNYASLECGAKVISTNKEANVRALISHVLLLGMFTLCTEP